MKYITVLQKFNIYSILAIFSDEFLFFSKFKFYFFKFYLSHFNPFTKESETLQHMMRLSCYHGHNKDSTYQWTLCSLRRSDQRLIMPSLGSIQCISFKLWLINKKSIPGSLKAPSSQTTLVFVPLIFGRENQQVNIDLTL